MGSEAEDLLQEALCSSENALREKRTEKQRLRQELRRLDREIRDRALPI